MATPNPMATSTLPPAPTISAATRHIAGHTVVVHGLAELPEGASHVSVLWLHHARQRASADMADIAARCVGAWVTGSGPGSTSAIKAGKRGLLAIAFDQRNHGGREVSALANEAWRAGNQTHAQDMFGMIAGAVVDNSLMIDLVQGSLFPERGEGFIDAHYVLGVSLGGHSAWQFLFADERVTAGVCIIGCPDYMGLLSDRARLSKLPTFDTADGGASFLGSKDFPPDLVRACAKYDPRGIVFGTGEPRWPLPREAEADAARRLLTSRLRGKKILNCSGGADKLVSYRCSTPFLDFLKKAAEEWADDLWLAMDDRVYAKIGHLFSEEMVVDAVRFIVEAVDAENTGTDCEPEIKKPDEVLSKI